MPGDKDEKTQRQKFEEAAAEYERVNGAVPDDALETLIGAAGETPAVPEAKARRKAGLPPASH